MKKKYITPAVDFLGVFTAEDSLRHASPSAWKWHKDQHEKERFNTKEEWRDGGEIGKGGWDPWSPID